MDTLTHGSGDNAIDRETSPKYVDQMKFDDDDDNVSPERETQKVENEGMKLEQDIVTPQVIDDNEAKLKERIAQCRNIIESLKIELSEEKSKLDKQSKTTPQRSQPIETPVKSTTSHYVSTPNTFMEPVSYTTSGMYSDSVENKLNCDENLIEYEKQLQKYQNTLNMAQMEKKNAIRKQMLAKAYRLKLLEVENQCNIELLRVKQSLQCLEPLQLIASKWKTGTDDDSNSYELIPRYPEISAYSSCDINSCKNALDMKTPSENEDAVKDDLASLD